MYKITHQGRAQWGTHTSARRLSRCSLLNTMIASTQWDEAWGEGWISSLGTMLGVRQDREMSCSGSRVAVSVCLWEIRVPTAPCGFPNELSSSPHMFDEAQPK